MDRGIKRVTNVAKGIVNLLLGADAVIPADQVRQMRNDPFSSR